MQKKYALVFAFAFILNLMWEYFHSALYSAYQGGAITDFVLWEATFLDALMILILVLVADKFEWSQTATVIIGGLLLSFIIEIWALQTGRWQYNELMPIVPVLNVGLTPFIQLGLTGLLTQKLCQFVKVNI